MASTQRRRPATATTATTILLAAASTLQLSSGFVLPKALSSALTAGRRSWQQQQAGAGPLRMSTAVEQVRGTDRDKLLDLAVLDRAMQGPPASLKVRDPSEQLRVGIIGGGLGGLITAMDLAEAGHKVSTHPRALGVLWMSPKRAWMRC